MEQDWGIWFDVADKLDDVAASKSDCLSTLCTLSETGTWQVSDDGQEVYYAPCDDADRQNAAERDAVLVETYTSGDAMIPTRVAQHFGLDEIIVCKNAGYALQGDGLIDRPVYQAEPDGSGGIVLRETTLSQILADEGDDYQDIYWKTLNWSHLQNVIDSSGGQSERFKLLAGILRRRAEIKMDSETFVPYGNQFADSDFIDAF